MSNIGVKYFHQIIRRLSSPVIPQYEFVPKHYTGPSISKTKLIKSNHIPYVVNDIYKKPLILNQGSMQWLYDHEGRRYLDLFGGIVTVSVGHCHPKVSAALHEQIDTLWHVTNIYRHPKLYEYVEKLTAKLPGDLKVVYLVNSGTEANDLAVILAKAYTGNRDVISLQSAYHGCSNGVIGLTSTQAFRHPAITPSGFYNAMLPDPYRGIWGGCRDSLSQVADACSCPGDCETSDKYVHQLSELLGNSVPAGRAAALFAESIQGVNGAVQFPKGYLRKAYDVIKKYGGLFVADEVQTGFGRTGDTYWGFENQGFEPDIVTLAKGIGNGFPMAAVITTKEIAAAHAHAAYFNTFGGNPLAAAAGKAVLEVIDEEGLQESNKVIGKYFIEQLMGLQKLYPVMGDVRGKGLMLAVELVSPGTKQPLCIEQFNEIFETIKDLGILIGRGGRWNNVLRIKPPMCINRTDVDFSIAVLEEAFKRHKNRKGPSLHRTEEIKSRHIAPALFNIYKKPLILHQGHKQWVFDHEGRRYLDLFGGIATISVGHSHPKVSSALSEQMKKLWHTTNIYRHPKIYEYTEELVKKFPKPLEVVYFMNSGSEANDLAVVLSRLYTGNQDIVSLNGSYHGCISGLMGLTSTGSFRQPNLAQTAFYNAMVPNPYRGIWGGCRDSLSQVPDACSCPEECEASEKYIQQLNELLGNSVPTGRLAAFFAECIQGVHGIVQFPKGYLRKAEKLVRQNGGLFVVDEVQTGFGRTGDDFWAFQREGLTPDIVTMAKGIGNGFPLAALITTKEIADAHTKALYFNTFGGNALACTVGNAVLEVIQEEKIQENSKIVGRYFLEQLMQLQNNYPFIGDVRGKGLMMALELVKPGTKEPLDNVRDVFETIKDLGILIGWGGQWDHIFRMTPPMCINKEDADFTVSVLEEAFKRHQLNKRYA